MIPLSFLPSFVYDKSMSERTQIGRGGGGGGKGRYSSRQGGGKGRKAILHSARKKRKREKEAGKGGAEEKEEGSRRGRKSLGSAFPGIAALRSSVGVPADSKYALFFLINFAGLRTVQWLSFPRLGYSVRNERGER